MKLVASALIVLAATSFAACDDGGSDAADQEPAEVLRDLIDEYDRGEFRAEYVVSPPVKDSGEVLTYTVARRTGGMLWTHSSGGQEVYFSAGRDGLTSCTTKLIDGDDKVCVREDTPSFAFLSAGSGADLLYDLKTNDDFTVVRIADREIAGVDGACFTLTGNRPPGSSRLQPGEIYELCLGEDGGLLFYSMGDGEFSIDTVATEVDHDVSRGEIEIPYEVVDEDE